MEFAKIFLRPKPKALRKSAEYESKESKKVSPSDRKQANKDVN